MQHRLLTSEGSRIPHLCQLLMSWIELACSEAACMEQCM